MSDDERKLAIAHWSYNEEGIRRIFKLTNYSPEEIDKIVAVVSYYYIEAMIHGIKHGEEIAWEKKIR